MSMHSRSAAVKIVAHPTSYRGTMFRSRLEARWAAFFDQLRWPWRYEPFELDGYIPDFLLLFQTPIIVEVKPALSLRELAPFASKTEASGWRDEALLVGVTPFESTYFPSHMAIGLLAERTQVEDETDWVWDEGILFTCAECDKRSVFHASAGWTCRACGFPGGNGHHRDFPIADVEYAWNVASSLMQWKGTKEPEPDVDSTLAWLEACEEARSQGKPVPEAPPAAKGKR